MIAQASVNNEEKSSLLAPVPAHPSVWSTIFWCGAFIVAIIVVGGGLPALWWGIWSMFAPIPTFFGFSRFWQDIVAGIIWAVIIGAHVSEILEAYEELSHDGEYPVSFGDIFWDSTMLVVTSIVGAIILLVNAIFLSLASGLVCYILAWLGVLIIWLICEGIVSVVIGFFDFLDSVFGGEAEETDTTE